MGSVNDHYEACYAATTLVMMANSKPQDLKLKNYKELRIKKIGMKRKIATKTAKPKSVNNRSNNNVEKKPRKQKRKEMKLTATPEMPVAMRERIAKMGGYKIELVIQKQLHDTDLNKNHGRLCLPVNKMKLVFVTSEEERLLNGYDDDTKKKNGMNVMIIDPALRESVICLKKWKIGSGEPYCLMTHWNSFVTKNDLNGGDVVQLWSFRMDGADVANKIDKPHHLCFAFTKPDIALFS